MFDNRRGSWAANTKDLCQYIQARFDQVMKITAIQTQGRNTIAQWVTKYKVSHSLDGKKWTTYKREGGEDKVTLYSRIILNTDHLFKKIAG